MYKKISAYVDEEICFHHVSYANSEQPEITSHSHDTIELVFVKKGDVTYNVDEKSYRVQDNSLIITWPNKIHSIVVSDSCDYDRYVLIFDKNAISSDVYDILPKGIDVLAFQSPESIISLFEKMDYYYMFFQKQKYKRLLIHIMEEIICNITIMLEHYPEAAVYNLYKANDVLADALQYIDEHITKDFTLDEISKDLHVSKSYLHKIFAQSLKVTPKKYIISRRLVLAQKDLKDKHKPTEVCLKYGYKDYSTFYRAYRNYFGVAPSREVERKFIREIID